MGWAAECLSPGLPGFPEPVICKADCAVAQAMSRTTPGHTVYTTTVGLTLPLAMRFSLIDFLLFHLLFISIRVSFPSFSFHGLCCITDITCSCLWWPQASLCSFASLEHGACLLSKPLMPRVTLSGSSLGFSS